MTSLIINDGSVVITDVSLQLDRCPTTATVTISGIGAGVGLGACSDCALLDGTFVLDRACSLGGDPGVDFNVAGEHACAWEYDADDTDPCDAGNSLRIRLVTLYVAAGDMAGPVAPDTTQFTLTLGTGVTLDQWATYNGTASGVVSRCTGLGTYTLTLTGVINPAYCDFTSTTVTIEFGPPCG